MQKITSLAIVLLLTASAFAQKGTTSLGLTFSGDYTHAFYTGGSDAFNKYTKEIKGKFGYTAGINASFQRREKGAFDIGLLYMRYHEYNGDGSSGSVSFSRVHSYSHLVSIPLNWLFYFNPASKTRVYTSIGFAPSYYFASTYDYEYNFSGTYYSGRKTTYSKEVDMDNLYLTGTVSVGVSQYLNENFELRIAPTYRVMTAITGLGDEIKAFPYFIGLNAGVYYKFNSKSPESRAH